MSIEDLRCEPTRPVGRRDDGHHPKPWLRDKGVEDRHPEAA